MSEQLKSPQTMVAPEGEVRLEMLSTIDCVSP